MYRNATDCDAFVRMIALNAHVHDEKLFIFMKKVGKISKPLHIHEVKKKSMFRISASLNINKELDLLRQKKAWNDGHPFRHERFYRKQSRMIQCFFSMFRILNKHVTMIVRDRITPQMVGWLSDILV